MNSLKFLETEWEAELDVGCRICIVSELVMIVETIVLVTHSESLVPCHTVLLPLCEPVELRTWLDEELHLHLLELPHTEDELTCHNLISEGLTDLCDTERNLHTTGLLYVEIVYENTLCSLRTQIDDVGLT